MVSDPTTLGEVEGLGEIDATSISSAQSGHDRRTFPFPCEKSLRPVLWFPGGEGSGTKGCLVDRSPSGSSGSELGLDGEGARKVWLTEVLTTGCSLLSGFDCAGGESMVGGLWRD